jgi:Relaxase/Mobilisation nuclease domain
MIFKASKRSGGRQLGAHLLKTEENEHVEIHEVSGFISDTVMGAMNEAYAAARGTKCQRYLFSMSLSPPAHESVRVETFEKVIGDIEERLGLTGQPRVIVFHEKEGRRHCHAVWSRINAQTMTAIDMPFFKTKLQALAKEVYLENGWAMPKGFANPRLRDARNFSLDEWQQAKRAGIDPRELRAAIIDSWKQSDNVKSFAAALEERGLYLARGDRRSFVAVTIDGDVHSITRIISDKKSAVLTRLGDPAVLPSVAETRQNMLSKSPRASHTTLRKPNVSLTTICNHW